MLLYKQILQHNPTATARSISEIANVIHDERAPYVGKYAFAHKAGMHADAVTKNSIAYEHINPEVVGNEGFFSCRKLREEALCSFNQKY